MVCGIEPRTLRDAIDTPALAPENAGMSVENWSDQIILVTLQDDPAFSDDVNALLQSLGERETALVLLDFAEVNFLNSSNIAKLLKLRKVIAGKRPGRLLMCGIQTSVWGVFLVTGLDKLFELVDNVPTGLATLQIGSDPGGKPPRRNA